MRRVFWMPPAALVLGALGWGVCRGASAPRATAPSVAVARGDVLKKALATGTIGAAHEISVKSKVSGIIQRLYVDMGDRVRRGDPLLEIRPDPTPQELLEARRSLELARLETDQAQREYERSKNLLAQSVVSPKEHADAERTWQSALIRQRRAEEQLALLDREGEAGGAADASLLRSPIDGCVLERLANVGDPVVPLTSYQAGTSLMTLADMDRLLFRGTVNEIDVGELKEGMEAEIRIGALPGRTVRGRLGKISPKSRKDENATVFDVLLGVLPEEGLILRAGYSATADLIVARREGVLTLPERVVEFREDRAFVRLPGQRPEDPQECEIRTGLSDGLTLEVLEGLEEGARVLEKPAKEIQ